MPKKEKQEPELVTVDGKVYFKAIEARDLKGGKKLAPYCKAYIDKDKRFKTEVMSKTKDPAWEETPRLLILTPDVPVEKVRFSVWHEGMVSNEYIGELSFRIADLVDGVPRNDWFVLKNKGGKKDKGELHLQIMYLEKSDEITKDKEEFSAPLQTLIRKGKFSAWEKLVQKEDTGVDVLDKNGMTALHVAAQLNKPDCVKTLLAKSADITIKDSEGRTPLHRAAEGSIESVNLLITAKAKVNEKDSSGKIPLHVAAELNQTEILNFLLQNGAELNAQDQDGNTPLMVAMKKGSHDALKFLVNHGADIYLENKAGLSACTLSLEIGKDNEDTQRIFYNSINVEDDREFPLKRKFPHRVAVSGDQLTNGTENWVEENPQYFLKGAAGDVVYLLMHYDDPVSKTTLQMEKCSFIIFPTQQSKYKEVTYWHDGSNYGNKDPIEIEIKADDTAYSIILYSKISKISGRWSIICYSESPKITLTKAEPWKHSTTIESKWEGKTAGGCVEHEQTFHDNPTFELSLESEEQTDLYILLEQQRNMMDVEAFKITPYRLFIGFYILSVEDIIDQVKKWKNARETSGYFSYDPSKRKKLRVIPSTYKPSEESEFKITVFSSQPISFKQINN